MIHEIAAAAFYASVFMLVYVYAGYPLLIFALSRIFPRSVDAGAIEPVVTILITAYNEERALRAKIENTLSLDYPADKLDILIASDGSTDKTDEIAGEYTARGVRLFRQEGRVGKTETQNNAVLHARGEIIFFSDATTEYSIDVVRRILPAFADATVGCVAGRLEYVNPEQSSVGRGALSYWSYETMLKSAESRACSIIGASGCLYAVRKSAYTPMYREACSDFLICTLLYSNGLRSVFEPAAVCFERTNQRTADEMRMRIRVIVQTLTDLWRNRSMLNPMRSGLYAIQLISHKLLRYCVPIFLMALLAANLVLAARTQFYFALLLVQVAFYALAMTGWVLERLDVRIGLLSVPFYFVLANGASIVALFKFVSGAKFAAWEPIRDSR